MTDFNENGQWTGTCERCGTNHEGYPPDTLGGETRCLRARAAAEGAVHVEAQLDQLEARLADERDRVLAEGFSVSGPPTICSACDGQPVRDGVVCSWCDGSGVE